MVGWVGGRSRRGGVMLAPNALFFCVHSLFWCIYSSSGFSVRVSAAEGRGRSTPAGLLPRPHRALCGRLHHARCARPVLAPALHPRCLALHPHQRDVARDARCVSRRLLYEYFFFFSRMRFFVHLLLGVFAFSRFRMFVFSHSQWVLFSTALFPPSYLVLNTRYLGRSNGTFFFAV